MSGMWVALLLWLFVQNFRNLGISLQNTVIHSFLSFSNIACISSYSLYTLLVKFITKPFYNFTVEDIFLYWISNFFCCYKKNYWYMYIDPMFSHFTKLSSGSRWFSKAKNVGIILKSCFYLISHTNLYQIYLQSIYVSM